MPQSIEADATLVMQDGLPPVAEEFWDKPGAQIRGRSVGKIRNVADKGVTIERPIGDTTVFPAPVQTQFVLVLEDGAIRMEEYDPERHGKIDDVPKMEVPPEVLLEQLYGDSGTKEISEGQQFSNERKKGASQKHWRADYHPPVRRR